MLSIAIFVAVKKWNLVSIALVGKEACFILKAEKELERCAISFHVSLRRCWATLAGLLFNVEFHIQDYFEKPEPNHKLPWIPADTCFQAWKGTYATFQPHLFPLGHTLFLSWVLQGSQIHSRANWMETPTFLNWTMNWRYKQKSCNNYPFLSNKKGKGSNIVKLYTIRIIIKYCQNIKKR